LGLSAHAHFLHLLLQTIFYRELLEKHGIDPYFGKENFVWALNGQGNHTKKTAKKVYETLEKVDNDNGTKEGMIDALKKLGEKMANGEMK